MNQAADLVNRFVVPAQKMITVVNEALQNPTIDILVSLSETKIDDKILAVLKVSFLRAAKTLELISSHTAKHEESFKAIQTKLAAMSPDLQQTYLFKLSSLTTKNLAEADEVVLDQCECDTLTQNYYASTK